MLSDRFKLYNDSVRYLLTRSAGVFLVLSCIVSVLPKSISFIHLNPFHNTTFDSVFIAITFLGDGIFAALLVLFFFLIGKKVAAAKIGLGFLIVGLIVQVSKLVSHCPRPQAFFAKGYYPYFIDGVTHSGLNSFPSGHASVAFVLAGIICCNCRNIMLCRMVFWLAVLVGYSRIYLGQHFAEDILTGMFLGLSISFIVEALWKSKTHSQLAAHELPA